MANNDETHEHDDSTCETCQLLNSVLSSISTPPADNSELIGKSVVIGAVRFAPGIIDITAEGSNIEQSVPGVVFEFYHLNDSPIETTYVMPLTAELAAAMMNAFSLACTEAVLQDMMRRTQN